MGLRRSKKTIEPRVKNLVVLDIGSQFLKALFLEIDKKKTKGILRSWTREEIKDNSNELYSVCEKAINKLQKNIGIKAEQLFLGINSDIIKGKSTTFCYKRKKPNQKIDLSEIKYLIQKVQWKAFDEIRKEFVLETGLLENKVKLVNAHIIDIKIDGNSIAKPLGFQGKELCLTIFNNYAFNRHLENLLKLSSRLKLECIGINSLSYALFHCLESANYLNKNVLIVDVGSKITEISLIKNNGEIIETRNFHLGGYSFSRALSEFLDSGLNEAETIKIQYSKRGVSLKAKRRLEKLLSSNIALWSNGVGIVLDDFSKKYKALPSNVFLCGEGSNLPGIEKALEKKRRFKTRLILPQTIIKIENRTKFQEIPCLALANLALEMPGTIEFSSILKRALRLIQE